MLLALPIAMGVQAQLTPFKHALGKWGYKNSKGEILVSPKYDAANAFSEGLAAVKLNDKWGFIDQSGREVIKPQYFSVASFSEGFAAVFEGKFGFIDRNGKIVIPMRFNMASKFVNGTAKVFQGGEWFYIDKNGNKVTGIAAQNPVNTGNNAGGKFKLLYGLDRVSGNLKVNPAVTMIRNNGVLEEIVASLNTLYKLPHDVMIRFRRLNTSNAFYNPNDRSIEFSLEMVEELYQTFSGLYKDQQLIDATTDAAVFVLFHEIGHALIHIFNIPISGREEEAADNFAPF